MHLQRLNQRRRVTCPASDLVVGVQCGGSDAFSGVTANPAVGFCADLLVRAGATIMFSENTEVRDAVAHLTSRAATPQVAQDIVRELGWYDDYLARGQVDRAANTTPGNKAGGLSNIVEKAMGSVIKSGTSAISHVLPPGEKLKRDQRGLVYAATPASDFICGTLQLAAGMNLHVFTTGRGTPYGLAAVPGDQSRHAQRPGAALARLDGPERRHHRRWPKRPSKRPAGRCSARCSRWPAAGKPGPSAGNCTTHWCCSTRRR